MLEAPDLVAVNREYARDHVQCRNMDINLENGGGNTRILPPSKAAMEFDDRLARQWARDHELKGAL